MIDHPLLIAYLVLFGVAALTEILIERTNVLHLRRHGNVVPEALRGYIDEAEFAKIRRYTMDNTRFSMVQTFAGKAVFLAIILSGLLPWLGESLSTLPLIPAGLLFFTVPAALGAAAGVPFDYYHSFVLEERYGFNTRTLRIWVADLLKSAALGSVIGAMLLSSILLLIHCVPDGWWVLAWVVFSGFQFMLIVLYPSVIAPLFNKFTPLENPALRQRIEALAHRVKVPLKGLFQMDASTRTRHTNAYLSGLGRTKRIVLYDSLLGSHTEEEIEAVLAHEIGHLKRHHIRKQLAIVGMLSGVLFFLASLILQWRALYEAFGFRTMPSYAGLFLLGVLWDPVGFFLSPVGMAVSRRFEKDADGYARELLGSGRALAKALRRLAKDNLSNLWPHPFYVWFHYSHPPLLERIRALEAPSSPPHPASPTRGEESKVQV
jgi:STE24 endopeptidase